ncbi:O-antigen ligase family protein [Demequina sediminis]|nr:hypothetical protein GCM10025873_18400 [Demequina sediminis]
MTEMRGLPRAGLRDAGRASVLAPTTLVPTPPGPTTPVPTTLVPTPPGPTTPVPTTLVPTPPGPTTLVPRAPRTALHAGAALIIAGPLVAVAGGRWGSYIGIPGTPVFLADLLVIAGLALFALDSARHGSVPGVARSPRVLRTAATLWVGALALGVMRGTGDLLAVRDALPFAYLALTPVLVRAVRIVGRGRVLRWVTAAAAVHSVWFGAAVFGVLPEISMPLAGIPVFTTRGDFDGLVCGIAIATMLAARRVPLAVRLGIIVLSAAAVMAHGSRAGLVAALLVVAVTVVGARPFRDERLGPVRLAAVFLALPMLLAAFVVAARSSAGWARGFERLVAGPAVEGSSNTTSARVDAWESIVAHVASDPWSRWLGEGFGSSFVADSGALVHLSGDAAVRQAHSFVIGWFAMLGIVGATLALSAVAAVLIASLRRVRTARAARIGAAIQVGLLFAALVGVILESPFGYMTYALAVALTFAADPDLDHAS